MRKALLLLVVLATFVAGCDNKYKDPDPQAMGYDYYPIEVGNYRVYNVTDIRFRDNVGDTSRFQMRERVDTSFHDQTGQLVYKVVRSIRPNDRSAWLDDSVMVVAKTERMVMLTKDNTKYVKLVFPVKEGTEWVGDIYNTKLAPFGTTNKVRDGKEVYTFTNVGVPFIIGESNFQTTATVIQKSSINSSLNLDERYEVYELGTGLAYRLFNRASYSPCNVDECLFGEEYKLEGHERHEILIDHGKL
ncbi:hypothetical protein [uncultured Pontibacter sp.]|uniref:hypothetical protein n=1 Tax=uncultured Pontibacter sp. TaxID=453356 RepID=UPI002610161A|nr:hypothetical protein [uncultured Pontibacter sp.]